MGLIFRAAVAWMNHVGGGIPGERTEQNYLAALVKPGDVVLDAGGGEGKLARRLIRRSPKLIVVLDREQTCREGADNSLYRGALTRLARNGRATAITPVLGDMTSSPLADRSFDVVVSSQVMEHLPDDAKRAFFAEAARISKPGAELGVSTPSEDFFAAGPTRISGFCRSLLPPAVLQRLPASLRGPWLVESLAEWEMRAGHYGHGCIVGDLAAMAASAGFELSESRAMHTRLTFFWFELTCTFPLVGFLLSPLARVAYAIESSMPARPGANLLLRFRYRGARMDVPSPEFETVEECR